MSESHASFYRENGYLVVSGLLDRATVDACIAEGTAICRGQRGPVEGLEPSTPDQSDDEIMGRYITCPYAHKLSPFFRKLMTDDRIADILVELIGDDVKGFMSQFWIKHAGMPGNAWHQDEMFVPTRDKSFLTVWIALDPATIENGCLRVFPGSHKSGILWPQRPHNDSKTFDRGEESYGFPYAFDEAVNAELAPGDAIIFNGYLLHGSGPNRTRNGFRRALLFGYSSATTPLAWHPRSAPVSNYSDWRDIVMVRGTDPYAFKGYEDAGRAFLRKAGPTPMDEVNMRRDLVTGQNTEEDRKLVADYVAKSGA